MGALGPPGRYWTVRLSPDEQRAAVSQGTDLFVFNSNGGQIRMTAGNESWNGVWAPDGSELIFSTSMSGVVRRGLAVGAVPAPLRSSQGKPTDWSPDKSSVLFVIGSSSGDIHVYDLRSGAMKPWLVTAFDENHPRFSSDGKWVAYTSDESGGSEIYIRAFAGEAQSVAVSLQGGTHPVWRRDGRELFFLATDGSMMAVDITRRGTGVEAGRPRVLFKIPLNDISTDWFAPYDVTDDGQRFLLNIPEQPEPLFFLQGLGAVMSRRK
jgi:Tol biopolymer transport system component